MRRVLSAQEPGGSTPHHHRLGTMPGLRCAAERASGIDGKQLADGDLRVPRLSLLCVLGAARVARKVADMI